MNTPGSNTRPALFETVTVQYGDASLFVRDEALQSVGDPVGTDPRRPVLLLHGTGLDHSLWEQVADRLIRSGRRVIRADMRGHGRSNAPQAGYGLDSLAADAIAVLDQLGVAEAHVVGHSLGGTVGVQVALSYPHRVTSVTTLGALIAGQTPPEAFLAWAGQLFELMPQGHDALLEALPDTAPYTHRLVDTDLAAAVRRVVTSSMHAAQFLLENFTDLQTVASGPTTPWSRVKSGELGAPLMTIDGSEDPVVSGLLEAAGDVVPGARSAVLQGVGHLGFVERPYTVARHLVDFIAQADSVAVLSDRAQLG